MEKLFTVDEMKALEKEANLAGLSYETMMENAGRGLANEIEIAYSHLQSKKIISIVGSGNNGGDALVALGHLISAGWNTWAYVVRKRDKNDLLVKKLVEKGGGLISIEDDNTLARLIDLLNTSQVLIDGVFGTGIKLPLNDDISSILTSIKKTIGERKDKIHVVAVDCPSGVDCDTGAASDATIPADITVTMAGIKSGLIRFPAAKLTGELRITGIGPIDELNSFKNNRKIILSKEIISKYLPMRPLDAHKGTFGTAFIIAGSVNYTGAALLSGLAAYRSGAGLVTLAIPSMLHEALSGHLPEATWVLLPHKMGVITADATEEIYRNINRATSVLIGPGLGVEDSTREFITKLFTAGSARKKGEMGFIQSKLVENMDVLLEKPLIIDADGLKLISKVRDWSKLISTPAILTPHPGEMSILTGLPIEEIQENRIEIAEKFSKQWGHYVVLKGAYTVIGAPDGQIAVVPIATPALARAGTGDVLAGLIAGFRAQGMQPFEAACAGAWIHGTAGIFAAKSMGNTASVIASDVLNAVSQVMSEV
jgi:hydroxyethylthiazole kinase-like uncharacterized protein yjeF